MNLKFIYKIIDNEEWLKAKKVGRYFGSPKDVSDGYIHFSSEDQIEDTLKKYFKNQKNLILLKVDTLKLDHLIWEQASDGNMFPHLYSSLEVNNVIEEFKISIKNEKHILPANF